MTFGDFKKTHKGGYMKYAADDIAGFARIAMIWLSRITSTNR